MDNFFEENAHKCFQGAVRESDYFAGVNSPVPFEARLPDGNWDQYLPDFDAQKHGLIETDACITFSAVESIETQINFLKQTGALPYQYVKELDALGFFDEHGNFEASERHLSKLDGSDALQGLPLYSPWDAIRTYGLVPYQDWPFDDSITSVAQFYADIPQSLIDKGKQLLKYFNFSYEWVANKDNHPIEAITRHLQHAPLCIGTAVCWPWNQANPPTCPSVKPEHSTMIERKDVSIHILDHYDPFLKTLSLDYNIPFVMKGVVTVKPIPPISVPVPSLPPNADTSQIFSWLTSVKNWLVLILDSLKGRNVQGLSTTSMTPEARGMLHIIAGLAIPVSAFSFLPAPWNALVGALCAGVIAFAAFMDQSLSKP